MRQVISLNYNIEGFAGIVIDGDLESIYEKEVNARRTRPPAAAIKAEAKSEEEDEMEGLFKKIDHVELVPSDPEKTIDFYTNVLDFKTRIRKEVDAPPMKEVIFLELGQTILEVISVQDPVPSQGAPWQVGYRGMALEVRSMEEAVRHLKEKGVGLAAGPVDLGNSLRAEIRDPDGLVIELREWK